MCRLNWLGFGIPGYSLVCFQCSSESNSFRLPWVCSCLNSKHRFNRFFSTGTTTRGDRKLQTAWRRQPLGCAPGKINAPPLSTSQKILPAPFGLLLSQGESFFLRDLIGRKKAARGRAQVRVLAAKTEFSYGAVQTGKFAGFCAFSGSNPLLPKPHNQAAGSACRFDPFGRQAIKNASRHDNLVAPAEGFIKMTFGNPALIVLAAQRTGLDARALPNTN